MQTRLLTITFLIVALAACTPATAIPAATPLPPTSAPTSTEAPIPATLVPTPFPTWPPFPVITPDAIQMAHWQEYQTELARCVLAQVRCNYPDAKYALCEWDILGQSGQSLYVWAECINGMNTSGGKPVAIHLKMDGSIQTVEAPAYGSTAYSDIEKMFPTDVQEKIHLYLNDPKYREREKELGKHILWRQEHPGELPLIILSTTPTP